MTNKAKTTEETTEESGAIETRPAFPTIGRIVIVKGIVIHASGSDEDPAIVNSASEFPVVLPNLNPLRMVNGVPYVPPAPTKPDAVLCYLGLTMFPEGSQSRNLRNVPFFETKEEALALNLPKSSLPEQNAVAYWPES